MESLQPPSGSSLFFLDEPPRNLLLLRLSEVTVLESLQWALEQAHGIGMSRPVPAAPHQLEAVAMSRESNALWSLAPAAGKTVTTLMRASSCHHPCFVVPPAIVPTWIEEIAKWTGRRQIVLLTGVKKPSAQRVMFNSDGTITGMGTTKIFPSDWLILTHPSIMTWFQVIKPDFVCYDEVHRLAGYKTKALNAVVNLGLRADRAVSMSGTLMAGGAHRLWVPCHLGNPKGGWGTYREFATRFAGAHESDYGGFEMGGISAPVELRERMAPFTLHYDSHEIGLPLPAHHVVRNQVYLDKKSMRELAEHSATLNKFLRDRSGQKRSSFLPGEVQEALIALGRATIPGTIPHAQDVVETGQRVVCWVWHREIAEELARALRKSDTSASVIHGGHTDAVVQNELRVWGSRPGALCITMALGGEGWNILARHAFNQIFVELPWLPYILRQAMARLVRPNQPHSKVTTRLMYLGVPFQASLVNRILERHYELGEVLSAPSDVEDLLLGVQRNQSQGLAAILGRLEL